MDYEIFRIFADSWGLLYLFALFLGVIFFTFRPGSKEIAKKVSQIPFDKDEPNV
ncbi:cbb3-type cytochrome oxidase subunit 3 [Pseudahrensia aquimaris]|uniref:Cbb3-type cytochrome oxidase subunit 3 n=1 Tax=Pseudahrensia aquimaris TaxID=744461 RepID=A0ABW3FFU0_9HYPH